MSQLYRNKEVKHSNQLGITTISDYHKEPIYREVGPMDRFMKMGDLYPLPMLGMYKGGLKMFMELLKETNKLRVLEPRGKKKI